MIKFSVREGPWALSIGDVEDTVYINREHLTPTGVPFHIFAILVSKLWREYPRFRDLYQSNLSGASRAQSSDGERINKLIDRVSAMESRIVSQINGLNDNLLNANIRATSEKVANMQIEFEHLKTHLYVLRTDHENHSHRIGVGILHAGGPIKEIP